MAHKAIRNRFANVPRLYPPYQAADLFHTTMTRLTEIASRKRGIRSQRTGKLVKLTSYFFRVGGGKVYLYNERELRRARWHGLLKAA